MLTDRQTNRQNYTNFERNLAMMMIYLPVKFKFDWTSILKLESGNRNVDGQTNGQKTDKRTDRINQFQKEPSYDGDLSPCQVYIQFDKAFSS